MVDALPDLTRLADEEQHARQALTAAMPRPGELVDRSLQLTLDACRLLQSQPLRARWHHLITMLATRSFNSLRLGHEALRAGYPAQAVMLVRSAGEDYLTAAYVQKHPRAARFWLAKKYRSGTHSRKIPSFKLMAKDVGPIAEQWYRDTYGAQSLLGHPRPAGLLFEWQPSPAALTYNLGGSFRRAESGLAYYHLVPAAVHATQLLGILVKDLDWHARARCLRDEAAAWMDQTGPARNKA